MKISKDAVAFRIVSDNPTTEELKAFMPAIQCYGLDVCKFYNSDEKRDTFKDALDTVDAVLDYLEDERDTESGAAYKGTGYLGGALVRDDRHAKLKEHHLRRLDMRIKRLYEVRDYLNDDSDHVHYILENFGSAVCKYANDYGAYPVQIAEFDVYTPVFDDATMSWTANKVTVRAITTEKLSNLYCVEDWRLIEVITDDLLPRDTASLYCALDPKYILCHNTHPDFEYKRCKDCGKVFVQYASEKIWFIECGMKPPVRCYACREKRKNAVS